MATALASAIVSFALVLAFLITFGTQFRVNTGWSTAQRTSQRVIADQTRTAVQLVAGQYAADGLSASIQVKNTGSTAVLDYDRMDVFLQYVAGGITRVIRPVYATGVVVPATGRWSRDGISPDEFQPGGWNPGETLTFSVFLPEAATNGSAGAVVVGTPNGVTVSGYLSWPSG